MVSIVAWVIFFIKIFSQKAHSTKGIVPVHACAVPFVLYSPTGSDYTCLSEVNTPCKTVTNRAETILKYTGTAYTPFLLLLLLIGNINSLLKKWDFIVHVGFIVLFCFVFKVVYQRALSCVMFFSIGDLYEKEIFSYYWLWDLNVLWTSSWSK